MKFPTDGGMGGGGLETELTFGNKAQSGCFQKHLPLK